MTFVYKEYEDKIKMVQEQWLQLEIKFLFGYYLKIVVVGGGGGEEGRRKYTRGIIFPGRGDEQI